MSYLTGISYALISNLAFALIGIVLNLSGLQSLEVMAIGAASMMPILIAYIYFTGGFKKLREKQFSLQDGIYILVRGISGVCIFLAFGTYNITVTSVIINSVPLTAIFVTALFLNEKLKLSKILWSVFGLASVLLVILNQGDSGQNEEIFSYGLLFALGGFTLNNAAIIFEKKMSGLQIDFLTPLYALIGNIVFMSPIAFYDGLSSFDATDILIAVSCGALSLAGFYFLNTSLYKIRGSTYTLMNFVQPVATAILAFLIFGAVVTPLMAVGMVGVFIAIYFIVVGSMPKPVKKVTESINSRSQKTSPTQNSG
jgi:drug/metabolite transporter (DMT)-like permease